MHGSTCCNQKLLYDCKTRSHGWCCHRLKPDKQVLSYKILPVLVLAVLVAIAIAIPLAVPELAALAVRVAVLVPP